MKKTFYTLSVDNYAPEITALTFPLMRKYAEKIGAEFYVIDKRKFPDFPCPYEKFQIKELSEKHKNDWNIFFDADTLIHPEFWDPTEIVGKEMTVSNGSDFVPVRFKPNKYFKRDGRFIGKGNWCLMASDWGTDIWSPLENMTPEQARECITPTIAETATVIEPQHLIDDYTVSLNIARYGLQHILLPELSEKCKVRTGYLWHQYLIDIDQKVFCMKKQIMLWIAEAFMTAEALLKNNKVVETKGLIDQLEYWRDKEIDWQDFVSVLPYGKKMAKIIKSWGIKFDLVPQEKIHYSLKKRLMLSAFQVIPDSQQKSVAYNAIVQWGGDPSWEELLGALDMGTTIANFVNNKFDVNLELEAIKGKNVVTMGE